MNSVFNKRMFLNCITKEFLITDLESISLNSILIAFFYHDSLKIKIIIQE